MDARFEQRDDYPWRFHQPPYERLVMLAPDRFAMTARLRSGEEVEIPLGRFSWDGFFPAER